MALEGLVHMSMLLQRWEHLRTPGVVLHPWVPVLTTVPATPTEREMEGNQPPTPNIWL